MMKNWIVATFKINEINKLEKNLKNQNFEYYLPKITIKKTSSKTKIELLFPGYIFVNTSFKNYTSLKYTLGIKDIIKFGDKISFISDIEIKSMRLLEEMSQKDPLAFQVNVGQDALIAKGTFKGSVVKITSLPSKKRIEVLLYFLGNARRVTIPEKHLIFSKY